MNARERQLKHENDELKRSMARLKQEQASTPAMRVEIARMRAQLAAVEVGRRIEDAAATARVALADAMIALQAAKAPDDEMVDSLRRALEEAKAEATAAREKIVVCEEQKADLARQSTNAIRRCVLAEDREAALFARLVKRLPADWYGRSVGQIGATVDGARALHVVLVDVLGWMADQQLRKRAPTAPAKKQKSGAQKRKEAAAKLAAHGGA